MMETTKAEAVTDAPIAANPAPGKKLREYESIYLLKPDLTDDVVEKLGARLRSIVHREGGKVLRLSNWGKKKTAYLVKHQARAIYIHMLYLGNPGIVAEFERNLRMTDDVLKYQTVKVDEEIIHEGRAVEADVKLAGDADQVEKPREEIPHAADEVEAFEAAPEDLV